MLSALLSVYLCLGLSDEFLLETDKQSATDLTGNKQYMTIAEFYEAKNEQQYEHNVLRHQMEKMKADSDKTLALLTSQIQQKLLSIENTQHVSERTNDTNELKQLKKVLSELKVNNTNELKQLKQIISELEDKNTKLSQSFAKLQISCKGMDMQLQVLGNSTETLKKVQRLEQLKNVKQLQDFEGLTQEVQTVSSRTHALDVNQQARNQDFLALFNQTIRNQNFLQNIKTVQNRSRAILYRKKETIDKKMNKTYTELIEKANEKVGFTSCANFTQEYMPGSVIKFEDVLYYVGIGNMSKFASTGKFNCTKEGLFQISVSIVSGTHHQKFGIYMNGHLVSKAFISSTINHESGTGVAVVALNSTDQVWVQPGDAKLEVHSSASCITVVKIK